MSNTILLKRSSVANAQPSTANLSLGELAINTNDGRLYTKIDNGTPSIFELTQNQTIYLGGNLTGTSTNNANGSSNLVATLTTTGVAAGTYGGSSGGSGNIAVITVDQYGRVTSASNASISTSGVSNGTSNIAIPIANGNIELNVGGTTNVAVITSTGVNITGYLSVTGNVNAANLIANTLMQATTVSATGNVIGGNVTTAGLVSATGNVTAGNLNAGGLSLSGNVLSNLVTVYDFSTTGNVHANGVLTDNYYFANGAPIDFELPAGSNNQVQFNDNGNFGASANFTFDPTSNVLSVIGNVNSNVVNVITVSATGNVIGANITTAGLVSATGNVSGNVGLFNDVNLNNATANRLLYTDANRNIYDTGFAYSSALDQITGSGNISLTGNVIGANLLTGGAVSATGNITGGNLLTSGQISTSGNVNANNVSATLISGTLTTAAQPNITSVGILNSLLVANTVLADGYSARTGADLPIQVLGANANILIQPNGTGVTDFHGKPIANISSASVSGNVTGGNVLTGGLVSASGNITSGANVNAGNVIATGLVQGGNVSASGNVTAGNLNTSGVVSATGNVIAGNINASQLSLSGNIISPITVNGNVSAGNLLTGGLVSATGNVTGGNIDTSGQISTPTVTNLGGGLTITTTSNGNINIQPNGTGNIVLSNTYINSVRYPVQDQDAASKLYVDNMASTGLTYHEAVFVATTGTLAAATGGTVTYAQPNGAGNGVGATLTTTGAFTLIDTGNVQTVGTRILVKNEANAAHNGVYTYANTTTIVRSTDTDEYGPQSSEQISINDYFFVDSGNVNLGAAYVVDAPSGTITFGTSNITFAEFSRTQIYSANTQAGLNLVNQTFNAKVDGITTAFDVGGNIIVKASANLTTPNIDAATGTSLSVTGNVTGGNLLAGSGQISTGGNITGGNMLFGSGIVSGTGNVTGGNLLFGSGVVSGTGNITGGNIATGGTGNIATLIVTTSANVTATTASTNSTSGALLVAGGLGVAGNVYAGALYDNGSAVLTVNSTVDGGTY